MKEVACRICALVLALAPCLGLFVVPIEAAGVPGGERLQEPPGERRQAVDESFFGYRPGEQRLYRLGPDDALIPGESAEWTVRFVGLLETDSGVVAEMEFDHHRYELIPGSWNPAEEIMEVRVAGRALMTRDGFPLRVEFEQLFVNKGERLAEDGKRRVLFTYLDDKGQYRKDLKVGRQDWDSQFRIPTYGEMDLTRPHGLFLYLPSSLGCLGTARSICIEQELAFANPGFLSLVMPYLLEEQPAERDFMFFMPGSVGASPFRPLVAGRWLSEERDNLGSQRRYFERWKLKLGASAEVEVGPRTMHAWELDMGGGIDRVWIEPGGRVLRVDLETGMHNPDERHIRLVLPHEEFVTPNADPAEACCR